MFLRDTATHNGRASIDDGHAAKVLALGWRRTTIGALLAGGLLLGACGDDAADAVDDAVDDAAAAAEDAGVDTDAAEDLADGVDTDEAAEDLADGVDTDEIDAQSTQLADTLRENGLTTLASAVEQMNLEELVGGEEFTLLAPNDEAFLDLTADDTADLLADPAELLTILRNHVVEERIDSAALIEMGSVTTAGGESLPVVADGSTVGLGRASVVAADIDAGGGVIHVIDTVLLP